MKFKNKAASNTEVGKSWSGVMYLSVFEIQGLLSMDVDAAWTTE